MAVRALKAGQVDRIVLTRPLVEAGERVGFLPGDLMAKVDPYLRPLYDALFDMVDAETAQRLLDRSQVEVRPWRSCEVALSTTVCHPGRGPEHHARTDEDVPYPVGFGVASGGDGRRQPGRRAGRS
ncbi:MAG: hypothetical protein Ct9H300mP31_08720 [Acidimicrobiaceae bacterium]|nr:MAG: hypothetical protein Ct9H300mP31_08720 [Acidimicrobiaceae bacterium]